MTPARIENDALYCEREAVYWLRREHFRGRTYYVIDYRRADGGVGSTASFQGPDARSAAIARLQEIRDRINTLPIDS